MNVLIIEDEPLAAQRLKLLLQQYDEHIQVDASLESIEETVQWLQQKPHPDLLLMDIQLSDGHSFEIFNQVRLDKPVIFTTAYDSFALAAFQHYSVDYILKPVTLEALAAAIRKYQAMPSVFSKQVMNNWTSSLSEFFLPKYKDRFLAKVGQRTFFIQTDEVAYFFADNKTAYLTDADNNRFVVNYTIDKIETLVDPHLFFRINRKIIVHSKMIEAVKPFPGNRLKLNMKNVSATEEFIISRERVIAFKQWAEGK
ncbi:MAG: response regulator transcription factor [Bacteroidetes bacterium]|nr:response regulator transcription factor [Bacteroidota bacterium]